MEHQWESMREVLASFFNGELERMILSNPLDPQEISKVKIRPLFLKGDICFQAEEQRGTQAIHRNLDGEQAVSYVIRLLQSKFRQCEMTGASGTGVILISKKGKATVKVKKRAEAVPVRIKPHNRRKQYLLEEGIPVPFLVDLGVMTADGQVVKSRYDKFRQINRFLEFIRDILPELPQDRCIRIIDFGCGKSYLTFAIYYYLRCLNGLAVRITGLDLKEDVIRRCSQLSKKYGYEDLEFLQGDIAGYEGEDQVDLVVTLHACDLATDYALEKAVTWGAKVILSVPCCQHELNGQMKNQLMAPVFGYGLIKERMAALYTDAIRAQVLEYRGYATQILEFIDMEHTPKNILIRAVRREQQEEAEIRDRENGEKGRQIQSILEFLQVTPTIVKRMAPELLR